MKPLTPQQAESFLGPMVRAADELAHHDERSTKASFVARRPPFPRWIVQSPWLDEAAYGPENTEALLKWVDAEEQRKTLIKSARDCVDEFYELRDALLVWQLSAYRQAHSSLTQWWARRDTCSLADVIGEEHAEQIQELSARAARLWWNVEDLWIEFVMHPRDSGPAPPPCPEGPSHRATDFYGRLLQWHPSTLDLDTVPYAFEAITVGNWQREINQRLVGWRVVPRGTGRYWMLSRTGGAGQGPNGSLDDREGSTTETADELGELRY